MRPEHIAPADASPIVGAAVLESRHDPERVLHIVVEGATGVGRVSLLDGELIAFGTTSCFLRPHRGRSATAVARVPMRFADRPEVVVPFFDVNVAVTWTFVPEGGATELDVAGTAYVFAPGDLRPEEFRARRRDDFNELRFAEAPAIEERADAAAIIITTGERIEPDRTRQTPGQRRPRFRQEPGRARAQRASARRVHHRAR